MKRRLKITEFENFGKHIFSSFCFFVNLLIFYLLYDFRNLPLHLSPWSWPPHPISSLDASRFDLSGLDTSAKWHPPALPSASSLRSAAAFETRHTMPLEV